MAKQLTIFGIIVDAISSFMKWLVDGQINLYKKIIK